MDKSLKLASLAQLLYLANLLAIPGIALLLLGLSWFVWRDSIDAFSCYYFRLALQAGCFALLVLGTPALGFWLLGYDSAGAWTTLLMYLLIIHTTLVVFGIYSLARAMTGKRLRD